jgi:hypothetical protein
VAYKLELHLVVKGDKRVLENLKNDLEWDLDWAANINGCEIEMAGGLVEITDGEENSEGVSNARWGSSHLR